MDRFTHSSAPVKKVQAVQFGILDPDFIVSVQVSGDLVTRTGDAVHAHTFPSKCVISVSTSCSGDIL